MGEFFRRMRYLLNRRRFDQALEEEMEFHREMAANEGRRNFGNTLRLREQSREAWGWTWIDRLSQDLRYAARKLFQSPGFTLTAIFVLAIGIGVNVTAFSLFNLVALKPLPVRAPDSLVRLQRRSPEIIAGELPYPSVAFYRDHARSLQAVMATMGTPPMEVENDLQPVSNIFVTANYFGELGTPESLGRLIDTAHEERTDAEPVAVLSYGFWQRRFGGDRSVVGRVIHLNKKPARVIGVLPFSFASLEDQHADVWLPLLQQPYFIEGGNTLIDFSSGSVRMWARLAPGVNAKTAEQELLALTNQLRKEHPKVVWDHEYIRSDPAGHSLVMQKEMYQIAAMIGLLVLLILAVACANLGGLLVARGVSREHEMTIRTAIGASRMRIFRQLFTESVLLALMGSAAGLVLSGIVLRGTLMVTEAPGWMDARPDWRVLMFAMAITLLAAVFFGVAPALQIARQRQRRKFARQVLVAAQVAASCVLLILSGLLVRAARHILYTDPGFGYEQVIGISPGLENHGYTPAAARAYLDQLKSRLQAYPGVRSVALSKIPMLGNGLTSYMSVEIKGHPVNIYPNWVDPDFFQTMSIPIDRGRNLLPGEAGAVVISESLARLQWPGENPVGKRLWPDGNQPDIIVGVTGNARIKALNDGDAVEAYWAAQPSDMAQMTLVVKTLGAPDGVAPAIKSMAERLDPRLFPYIWLLKKGFHESAKQIEQVAAVVSVLGTIAVLLAAVGMFGLVAYAVSQNMKETAIRIALGAKRAQVLASLLRQFVWPVALGLVTGVGVAIALSKTLRKVLYGVSNLDALSYSGAIALLATIVLLAMLLPAKRALRPDLAKVLHYE